MAVNQSFNQDSQGDIGIAGLASTTAPTYTTGTENPISLTTAGAVRTDSSATTQPISASSLPLPAGASTSALQTTGNTSLASIDSKTPALGQALAAASVPVVLTASQLTTLTPLTSVTVTQATGTNLHAVIDSGTVVVTQPTGTNLHTVIDSGTVTVNNSTYAQGSTTAGELGPLVQGATTSAAPTYTTATTNPLSLTTAGALRTDSSATTQPISASALPLPTGAATSALQTTGNTSLASISSQLPASIGPQSSAASLSIVQATGTTFAVSQSTSSTGTLTSVANSVTTGVILASNAARKGFIVYNDSLVILYLAFFATATTSAFSAKLQPATAYTSDTLYTGVISGISSAASGNARVTEFT